MGPGQCVPVVTHSASPQSHMQGHVGPSPLLCRASEVPSEALVLSMSLLPRTPHTSVVLASSRNIGTSSLRDMDLLMGSIDPSTLFPVPKSGRNLPRAKPPCNPVGPPNVVTVGRFLTENKKLCERPCQLVPSQSLPAGPNTRTWRLAGECWSPEKLTVDCDKFRQQGVTPGLSSQTLSFAFIQGCSVEMLGMGTWLPLGL